MAVPGPMLLTHKYRLNPTRAQHRALEAILEQQRQLYNAGLPELRGRRDRVVAAWRNAGIPCAQVAPGDF